MNEKTLTAFLYAVAVIAGGIIAAEYAKRGIDHLVNSYDVVPQPEAE